MRAPLPIRIEEILKRLQATADRQVTRELIPSRVQIIGTIAEELASACAEELAPWNKKEVS